MAQTQFVDFPVFNALIPREGPKAIPVLIDFSVTPTYQIDLQQVFSLARMTILQTLWVDNSANTGVVNITVSTINQTIKVPPSSQGYYPLLSGPEPTLTVSSVGGGKIQIHLLNIPVQSQTWSPAVTPFAFSGNALIVSDPVLVAASINNLLQTQPNLVGDGNLAGPEFRGSKAFRLNLATAVATDVIVGAPAYFVTNIDASFTPDVTLAVAGIVTQVRIHSSGGGKRRNPCFQYDRTSIVHYGFRQ